MKLSILERLLIIQLLPKEHNLLMMEEARDLRKRLSISDEENKIVDLRECSDWGKNGCPVCGGNDFVVEKDGKFLTNRRTCNECGCKGAQGVDGVGIWHELPEMKDVEISEAMIEEISIPLRAMDKNKKLKDEHVSVYKKIVTK